MPVIFKDRVYERCTIAGTGNVTLTGALAGYQTFLGSGLTNGQSVQVALLDNTSNEWEVVECVYNTPATLVRSSTPLSSSNSGAAVNFSSGSKFAHIDLTASYLNSIDATLAAATVRTISSNTTLNVPATYSTIQAALDYLDDIFIEADATVTIQVADGTHTNTAGVVLTHPQGGQIQIIGNTTTPSNCILTTATANNGIFAQYGNRLGLINGFRIRNTGTKGGHGILAEYGASIRVGPKIEIDNYYYGIAAKVGGSIDASGTSSSSRVQVTNAGDVGIWAFTGGFIRCQYALVDGSIDAVQNLGFGIIAEYGSVVDCQYAETMNNHRSGIASFSGSSVRAYDTNTHDNTTHGYEVRLASNLTAHSGTSADNGSYGASHDFNSSFSASPAVTYSGNTDGTLFNSYVLSGSGASIRYNSTGPALKLAATNVLTLLNGSEDEIMRFDLANGRFGIGTSSPSTQIDVLKDSANSVIKARTSTSGNAQLELDHATSGDFGVILFRQGGSEFGRIQHTNSGNLIMSATTQILLRTASNDRLLIDVSGILDYKQAAVTAGAPFTNTAKVPVKINGASYNIMLCA